MNANFVHIARGNSIRVFYILFLNVLEVEKKEKYSHFKNFRSLFMTEKIV